MLSLDWNHVDTFVGKYKDVELSRQKFIEVCICIRDNLEPIIIEYNIIKSDISELPWGIIILFECLRDILGYIRLTIVMEDVVKDGVVNTGGSFTGILNLFERVVEKLNSYVVLDKFSEKLDEDKELN